MNVPLVILLLTLPLTSGCYTTAAIVDLAKSHPPSVVIAEYTPDQRLLSIETTHGSLPSDVVLIPILPPGHLLTHHHTQFVLPSVTCTTLTVTVNVASRSGTESLKPGQRLPLFRDPPFPLMLSATPPPPSADFATCSIVAEYPANDRYPKPHGLALYQGSSGIQSLPLPIERGVLAWRRWAWLPISPVLDVAALVIVPPWLIVETCAYAFYR